jgi:acyl dehydratase
MPTRYFEDFQEGETIELGSRPLSEAEIIQFARQFDPQPFHLDPDKAEDSIFGGLVASGWHTIGLYMRLLVDNMLNDATSLGSPGLDNLRFSNPVRPGDTLTGRFTVLELRTSNSRPTVGIIKGKGEMLNQKGQVVLSLESIGFFGRRPTN